MRKKSLQKIYTNFLSTINVREQWKFKMNQTLPIQIHPIHAKEKCVLGPIFDDRNEMRKIKLWNLYLYRVLGHKVQQNPNQPSINYYYVN